MERPSAPSSVEASAPHPFFQDGTRRQRGWKSLAFGAGLQALALAGIHAAGSEGERERGVERTQADERATSAARHQAIEDRVQGLERYLDRQERIRQERSQVVERAWRDVERGAFDLGEFFLQTNRLDALEDENRELDTERARAELERLVARFQEYFQKKGAAYDDQTILRALEHAVRGYNYHGVDGLLLTDTLNERVAECSLIGDLLLAVLWKAGIRAVGLRVYAPPPGQRFGHRAPILFVRDGRRVSEVDIVSGGDPYRDGRGRLQGVLVRAPELVEAYAAAHGIPLRRAGPEPVPGSPGSQPGTHSGSAFAFSIGSGLRGEHFRYPVPPPTNANGFPDDASPAHASGIMHLYESDNGRIRWRNHGEGSAGEDAFGYALFDARDAGLLYARAALRRAVPGATGPVPVTVSRPGRYLVGAIASSVDLIDATLQQEAVPERQAVLLASSAAMWSVLQETWTREGKPRSALHAERLARRRLEELRGVLPRLSPEGVVDTLRLFESKPFFSASSGYEMALGNLAMDHERGWPLLFEVLRRCCQAGEPYQGSGQTRLRVASALIASADRDRLGQVWELLRTQSIADRVEIYDHLPREIDDLLEGPMAEEAKFFSRVWPQRTIAERASGIVRSGPRHGSSPETWFKEPIIRQGSAWRTFEDISAWVRQNAQARRLGPAWEARGIYRVLEVLAFLSRMTDAPEATIVRPLLRDGVPWLRATREQLISIGIEAIDIDSSIRRIERL